MRKRQHDEWREELKGFKMVFVRLVNGAVVVGLGVITFWISPPYGHGITGLINLYP